MKKLTSKQELLLQEVIEKASKGSDVSIELGEYLIIYVQRVDITIVFAIKEMYSPYLFINYHFGTPDIEQIKYVINKHMEEESFITKQEFLEKIYKDTLTFEDIDAFTISYGGSRIEIPFCANAFNHIQELIDIELNDELGTERFKIGDRIITANGAIPFSERGTILAINNGDYIVEFPNEIKRVPYYQAGYCFEE